MEQFEHIKPLLVFEVITHENKILHINSLSYETNGNYVTFYRAIVENKHEDKIDENNKEIIKKKLIKMIDYHSNELYNKFLKLNCLKCRDCCK